MNDMAVWEAVMKVIEWGEDVTEDEIVARVLVIRPGTRPSRIKHQAVRLREVGCLEETETGYKVVKTLEEHFATYKDW